MRIAVLSDVHGNLMALEQAVGAIRAWSPDLTWFLGDAALLGPDPAACIQVLDDLSPDISIEGNTDRYLRERAWEQPDLAPAIRSALEFTRDSLSAADMEYLSQYQRDVTVEVGGISFLLCHGAPGDDEARLAADEDPKLVRSRVEDIDSDVILCGHTHIPWQATPAERLVINDGSVGYPFDGDVRGCWCALEIEDGALSVDVRRFHYDREETIRRIRATGKPFADVLARRLETAEQ